MDAVATELTQLLGGPAAMAYLPALARVGAVLAVAPPFAAVAVPARVRALIAMALTLGLLPAVSSHATPLPLGALVVGIGGEVLVGLAMGLSLSLVFTAAQWAGELVTQQMGLSLSEIYDPGAGGQAGALGQAYWLLAVVVFLGANGHHAMLRGIAASFDAVPVMTISAGAPIVSLMVGLLQSATGLAIQLAAPVFVTMLVVDLALGMVGRTVPQLGMMTAGVTIRSIAGLVVMVMGMALTAGVVQGAAVNWMSVVQSSLNGLTGQ
ncbi:MAG: flagellar biosynthesis protein FliR [Phycisphaerales bacterium]|nr:flagellar biosynthesis protein FliR [Phycisphaerales bacterium]